MENRHQTVCRHDEREIQMKPNAPKKTTWFIALALIILAVAAKFTAIVPLTAGYWLAVASSVLLLLATLFSKL